MRALLDSKINRVDLTEEHLGFLRCWTRLQLLEHAASSRVDGVLARIASESVTGR